MIAKDYIYDLELINENDSLGKNNDFIYSINTQIILQLLSQSSTEKMLCNQIKASRHLILLCLDRLLKKNVIKIEETFINDGKLENKYKLVSEDFDMITKYMGCAGSKDVLSQKIILDNFTNMIEKIIKNTCENKDVPNLMKGTFIKINSDKIDNFKKELQLLIDRFEDLEDKDEKSVYGFVNILGLYSK